VCKCSGQSCSHLPLIIPDVIITIGIHYHLSTFTHFIRLIQRAKRLMKRPSGGHTLSVSQLLHKLEWTSSFGL
jgi:hypothetical protein